MLKIEPNDCLTVLCSRVTQLSNELIGTQEQLSKAQGYLKKTAEEAEAHNTKSIELVDKVQAELNKSATLELDGSEEKLIGQVQVLVDQLREHLK